MVNQRKLIYKKKIEWGNKEETCLIGDDAAWH